MVSSLKGLLVKVLLGVTLAFISARALILSFPPYNLWPLIFVAFVPMAFAQHRILPEKLSSVSPAITIGLFLGFYFGKTFTSFGASAWYMKALPLIIAVFAFLIDRGNRRFHERTNYKWFVLDATLSWVTIEFIRMFIPSFGTWAFVPYALYPVPVIIQPIKIVGIFGLSLIILFFNYSVAYLLITRKNSQFPKALKTLKLSVILLASWILISIILYVIPISNRTVKIATIQTNPSEIISSENFKNLHLERLMQDTKKAAKMGAKIILWAEGALDYDPKVVNTDQFKSLSKETNAYIGITYVVQEKRGYRNEITILSPGDVFLGVYGKDHAVTFAGEKTSVTRGTYSSFKTDFGQIGTIICYDLDFTDTSRKVARNGAQIILAPSADWPEIYNKHYIHSVFRAVENNVSVVKAEWAFDSAIIDTKGRIIAKSVSYNGQREILLADVPLGSGKTIYNGFAKDILGFLSLRGTLAFAFFKFKKR